MKTITNLLIVTFLTVSVGNLKAANSDTKEGSHEREQAFKTLEKAVMALDNVMEDPENSIPLSLIEKSEGIVIFPSAFKVALGTIGGQGGRGVAMIRKDDGTWSNPFFVNFGDGSLGFQIGAQSSDIVLLFKHRNDILEIDEAEIMLGGDVGVAAGPVGKGASSNTDIKFDREIYTYHQSRGLFAGVSVNGGILTYNEEVNNALYEVNELNTDKIFYEIETPFNHEVGDIIEALNMYSE